MSPRPSAPPPTLTERSLRNVTWAWVFGSVYFTAIAGAPLTLFAWGLGATPFVFGLLAAAPFAASLLSLPAAIWSDHTGRRKGIFMGSMYLQRLLWLPIALLPTTLLVTGLSDGPTALGIFVALYALMHCLGAIGGPAWMSWMADIVPRRVRGRYFARRRQWGIATALPAALLVGFLLDRFVRRPGIEPETDPQTLLWWCGGIFAVAAIFGLIDIAFFHRVPHKAPERDRSDAGDVGDWKQLRELLASLTVPLRNRRFMAFALFSGMLTFATAPMGHFVTLMLVERVQASNLAIQTMLLVTPMLGQLAVFGVWGRAVDRFGKKPVLTAAMLGIVPVAAGWAMVASHANGDMPVHWGWIVLGFAISLTGGLAWTGVEVANFNYVLEVAGTAKGASRNLAQNRGAGSGYVAVNSVVVNVSGMFGGLTFGYLASRWQEVRIDAGAALGVLDVFALLFLTSAALRLASGFLLPLIREDPAMRHHRTREAVRFVGANLYNNLQQALLLPVRWVRVRPRDTYRP